MTTHERTEKPEGAGEADIVRTDPDPAIKAGPAITLTRDPDGNASWSWPKKHRHHDTTESIEWGFNGSGPADLALNILAEFLPGDDKVLWDKTRVSQAAWDLHQAFKQTVIAAVPIDGGEIPARLVRDWIAARM